MIIKGNVGAVDLDKVTGVAIEPGATGETVLNYTDYIYQIRVYLMNNSLVIYESDEFRDAYEFLHKVIEELKLLNG